MELGEIIKSYRKSHDLSMRAFGRLSGLSVTQISFLENGRKDTVVSPTMATYQCVAKVLGIDVLKLIEMTNGISDGDKAFMRLKEGLAAFEQMDEAHQQEIRNMIRQLFPDL